MKPTFLRRTAAVLAACLLLAMPAAADNEPLSYWDIADIASEYDNISEEFLDDVYRTSDLNDMISVEDFQELAQEHHVKLEFLQRFFHNHLVYSDYGRYIYDPVDTSLPLSNYQREDFTKYANGEISYTSPDGVEALKGIDVSKYQGKIDWERVKADGVDFAIIRLGYRGYTKGQIFRDARWEENIQGALDAGIQVGVYFFSQAINEEEAVREAQVVLDAIEGYDITFPVVYDVEEAGSSAARTNGLSVAQRTANTIAFCETVADAGYRPMIYSYTRVLAAMLDLSQLTQYDKWVAQYYDAPFFPYEYQMWQYSSTGKVDGISGNVDMNLCFVDYGAL